MRMDIVNAVERLTTKPRRVEVVDIAVGGVEQVEHVDSQLDLLQDLIAALNVDQAGGLRSDRVVFDEGPGAEVPPTETSGGLCNPSIVAPADTTVPTAWGT